MSLFRLFSLANRTRILGHDLVESPNGLKNLLQDPCPEFLSRVLVLQILLLRRSSDAPQFSLAQHRLRILALQLIQDQIVTCLHLGGRISSLLFSSRTVLDQPVATGERLRPREGRGLPALITRQVHPIRDRRVRQRRTPPRARPYQQAQCPLFFLHQPDRIPLPAHLTRLRPPSPPLLTRNTKAPLLTLTQRLALHQPAGHRQQLFVDPKALPVHL